MRIPQRRRHLGLELNLTPLIDIVFLLNIFFLVASYFVRPERFERVTLPVATQGQEERAPTANRLVVTITGDGRAMSEGGPLTIADLPERLTTLQALTSGQGELRLRTDRAVAYRHVEPFLEAAAQAGLQRVRFSVLPE